MTLRSTHKAEIRTRARPSCLGCGELGAPLHEALRDRLFGAPGRWSVRRCPAPECGMLWLDPAPLEEDLPLAYRRYHTHEPTPAPPDSPLRRAYRRVVAGYLADRYGYASGPRSHLARTLSTWALTLHPPRRADADDSVLYLPAEPGGRLLDVGCGSGAFLERMRGLGWGVEGVDPDPVAARRAAERGLPVYPGTLRDQGYPDGCFDAVTMAHVVEHVVDPAALLAESHRVVKPGGRLVVVTPNARSWGHRLFGPHWRGLEPPRHLHVFTARALTRLVRAAGFGRIRTSTTIRDANGMLLASRALRRRRPVRTGRDAPRAARAWGRAMQLVEWLFVQGGSEAGEEIVLVAVK